MKKIMFSCGDEYSIDLTAKLADNFSLKLIDNSEPLIGNYVILSRTIHNAYKLLKEYKQEELFFVIGWTDFTRLDLVTDNFYYKYTPTETYNIPEKVKEKWNLWQLEINPNRVFNKFGLEYFTLINFLNSNNIDYVMYNTQNRVEVPDKNVMHEDYKPCLKIFEHMKNNSKYFYPFESKRTLKISADEIMKFVKTSYEEQYLN